LWAESTAEYVQYLRQQGNRVNFHFERLISRASISRTTKRSWRWNSVERLKYCEVRSILLVVPTVMYGGLSIRSFLPRAAPGYVDNPLRHDLWRAGHAHAGVYLVLSLVMLRYVDEAALSGFWKWLARVGAPVAAILIPSAFFLSVASPSAKEPNGLLNLAYVGAGFLAAGVLPLVWA
jgi:hypothetical protein